MGAKLILPKQFNEIYYFFDAYARINLLFQNNKENFSLYFDGHQFIFRPFATALNSDFKFLNHKIESSENGFFEINAITSRDDDITFIKFSDGTIFQLYFMMDDESFAQRLAEFGRHDENVKHTNPLGVHDYEAAINRFESGHEVVIKVERST